MLWTIFYQIKFVTTSRLVTTMSRILFESKYQLFINARQKVGIKEWKNVLIDYSQTIDDFFEKLEENNPIKKGKVLILFGDLIDDTEANKILSLVVLLFLRETILNISLVLNQNFILKKTRTFKGLNATYYFIMKVSSKRKLNNK